MTAILLKNASIIDHKGNISIGKDIYIEGNIIKSVMDTGSEIPYKATTIDCSSFFVTPGFVNLHTHSPMNIFKGIAEDVDIDAWFNEEIWPFESKMTKDDVYVGAMLGIAEMIDSGVTAFADHYFNAESIIQAIVETGIRGDIAPTLFGMAPNFDEQLSNNIDLIEKYRDKYNNLNIRFGPHSPYTCNEEQLKNVVKACKETGAGMHIHVSETKAQVDASLGTYKKTPLKLLHDIGALECECIIAHGLWIEEDEAKYLTDKNYVAACPKTYMKLSMGQGDLWKISKEINIGIGSDGAASSNNLAPIEQTRLFGLNGKFMFDDARDYDVKYLWAVLMNGHNALPFKSGVIKQGYNADLLIWDLNRPNTMPNYNPLTSIIYSSNNENIRYNIVGGRVLKEDGVINMNMDALEKSVRACVEGIINRGKGNAKVFF